VIRSVLRRLIYLISQPQSAHLPPNSHIEIQSAILASRSRYLTLNSLSDADVKIYSQWGEDGILDYLCDRLEIERPKFLEIGAGDFTECNSRFLVEFRNASATLVDADPNLEKNTRESNLFWQTHLYPITEWVSTLNINSIIDSAAQNMNGVDIFSLDLDGNDYWILKTADLSGMKIVVVEYNSIFGAEHSIAVLEDQSFDRRQKHYSWLYYGASLKAYIDLLRSKGFIFVGTNRVRTNAFFIQHDEASNLSIQIPTEISEFTDCKIRESRDETGQMSHLELARGLKLIRDQYVFDLERQIKVKLGEVGQL